MTCCGDLNATITNNGGNSYTLTVNGTQYTATANCTTGSVTFSNVNIDGCVGDIVVDGHSCSPCCGSSSSSGSQSSGSGSGSGSTVGQSCLCYPLPSTLHVTISNGGNCTCVPTTSFAITETSPNFWEGSIFLSACGFTYVFQLTCQNGKYVANELVGSPSPATCSGGGRDVPYQTIQCSPFQIQYSGVIFNSSCGCGSPGGDIVATVTT